MRFAFCVFAVACASNAAAQVPPIPGDSISLYGSIHAQVEHFDGTGGVNPPVHRTRFTDQASRLGVRGTEDIGGGITVWFQLETDFSVDTPDSPNRFAERNSGVGFHSSLGTIIVGRWDSVYSASQVASIDPFLDIGLPDITGAAINQGHYARKDSNVVQYLSPRGPGWRTRWSYQVPEVEPDGAKPQSYGVGVAYIDGVTYFAIAYEKHKDQFRSETKAGFDEDGRGVALSRRFGPIKFAGQYGIYRATAKTTQKSYMVGFESIHGPHELLGSNQDSRGGGDISQSQPSCSLVGAGYRYRFSLRTYLMAQYARVNNRVGNLCNFGSHPISIIAGRDLRGFGLGLRTSF